MPVRVPLDVGVNVTEIEQLAPAARLDPQLCVSAKSPDVVIELMFKAPLPEFDSVMVLAAAVVPTICDPKLRLVGEIDAEAAAVAVPCNSTC